MALSRKGKKVFVGLSGGVDSAVSAALLQKEGYDVTGVFIRISIEGYPCTAGEDKLSAQRVAAHLGIPFVEIDLSEEYKKEVFAYTVSEFAKGRTPNPDTLCNEKIKFGSFYHFAKLQNVDYIATGHYAQIKNDQLYAGADPDKDQSYFLWMMPQTVLSKTIFPVGGLLKSEVRALAQKFYLPNAARKDSQGLCFLGPVSMSAMLKQELHPHAGKVLNESGEVIGEHSGSVLYTLGQRHGFILHPTQGETAPHYVIAKDVAANTITVSINKLPQNAKQTRITLNDTNWLTPYATKTGAKNILARYRYRQTLISGEVIQADEILLHEPQYVPEGQSLVLYLPAQTGEGECVLGGGVVDIATVE